MNHRIVISLIGLFLVVAFGAPVFAQTQDFELSSEPVNIQFLPLAALAQAAVSDIHFTSSIRNNRYYIESVRLANLAQAAFADADYEASTRYSEEAIRFALLSDEWVILQLKIRETDDAITLARLRLEWATSPMVDAARRYPQELGQAQSAYSEARILRSGEIWDPAIAAAQRVIYILAYLTESYPLPAQYTISSWGSTKDCLWNIAGQPWAYNDPTKWPLLYNANRPRMPELDNPHLIHPGMILDIPSIRGETREGMWVEGRSYVSLQ